VLETEELTNVFAAVAHPDPEEAKVVERSVMPR
jgi:hypothetical protein